MKGLIRLLSFLVLCIPLTLQAAAFTPVDGEFVISGNIIPDSISDDVPTLTPAADVDDGAYLFRVAYQWPSDIKDAFGVSKSSQEYYSLAFSKYVVDVEDDYVESSTGIAVLYGRKYFINSTQREGLAIGWYAGASSWSSDGYDYSGTTRFAAYSEDGFSVLAAAEVRYDAYIRLQGNTRLVVFPSLGVTVDTEVGEVEFFPTLMVGVAFK